MKETFNKIKYKDQSGFTLIEILIVVILLGILATIIIPQITVSSDDAKFNALKTNLANMRSAIELYYYQHSNTYPGAKKETDGSDTGTDAEAVAAFKAQVMYFSKDTGETETDSGVTGYPYGPYIKGGKLPSNPYNDSTDIVCDFDETDITERDSGTADVGWKFYPKTGVLIAADGDHDNL